MTNYKHTRAFINKVFMAKLTPSNDSELLEEVMELMLATCQKKAEKPKIKKIEKIKEYPHYTCGKCHQGFYLDPSISVSALKEYWIGEDRFVLCPKCEFELISAPFKPKPKKPKIKELEWNALMTLSDLDIVRKINQIIGYINKHD